MDDLLQRIVDNLSDRVEGPFKFRFILQPAMAAIFAFIDGFKDARKGRPPYFWVVIFSSEQRKEFLNDGWKHVGKIFIIAIILDMIYQIKVSKFIYPGETIIAALILAIVPYLLLRGPVNRITRLFLTR